MPDWPRVVCNATPIIALSLIDQLPLLARLYGRVAVPPAVAAEIRAGGQRRAGLRSFAESSRIEIVSDIDLTRAALLADLDRGEAEVIALALAMPADLVIVDERLARLHAARLGIAVTGTLGVLLRAKRQGHVPQILPLVEQLVAGGIYMGGDLIAHVLASAGE